MQEVDKYSFGEAKEGDSRKGGPMPEAATGYAPSACKT